MEKEKEKEMGQAGRDGSLRPEWRESILVRIAPLQCGALRRIHAMLSIHGVQPQKGTGSVSHGTRTGDKVSPCSYRLRTVRSMLARFKWKICEAVVKAH